MKAVKINKISRELVHEMKVPGSKSMTNRALIMAMFADGVSKISGVLKSDDCDACIKAISELGVDIKIDGEDVEIKGENGFLEVLEKSIDFNSSGTLARFLPGLLSTVEGGVYWLDGSEQLRQRPLTPLIETLRRLGAEISDDKLPLVVKGKKVEGGTVDISSKLSTQYVSGLLMAAPYFEKVTEIKVKDVKPDEESYIMMTYQMMKDFGAKITFNKQNSSFIIMPERYKARDFTIEADFNTANYFFTLATVTGSEITVTNVDGATLQPGIIFLEVLQEMGAEVQITDKFIRVKGPEKLKGGFSVDMKKIAEMALNVAAIAPFADDEITMTNLEHIRGHECDRLKAMSENLTALGIKNKEHKDGITIYPGVPQNVVLDTFEDHRVAMSFALTGIAGNGLTLKDPDCVSKTCPTYFDILRTMGIDCEDIEI